MSIRILFITVQLKTSHINNYNRRKRSANVDMTVIANMAYGQVKLGTDRAAAGEGNLAEYEDPERLTRFGEEQERYELSGQWQYESIPAIRLNPVST